jgi:integrase/recombinase XerD
MLTLFLSKNGRRLHPNQLSAIVRNYLESAGIDKQGACHLLRHSAATLMLEGGADVRYIQAMLGHVSLATTQIYTHVTITKLRQVHQQTHPAQLYRTSPEPPKSSSSEDENESNNPGDSDDDDPDAAASVV